VRISASAPTRIDLAGGTIDIWPLYLFHAGAQTLNAAIGLRAHVELVTRPDGRLAIESLDRGRTLERSHWSELPDGGELDLLSRLLRVFRAESLTLRTRAESPAGAGLGGSSALAVAVCGALARWADAAYAPDALMALAMNVEAQALGVPTGVQDYRPAYHGGIAAIEMGVEGIRRVPLDVDPRDLERRLVLAYTGEPRNSGTNNWEITKRHVDGDPDVFACFERIRDATAAMRAALAAGDWPEVGRQLALEWDTRKRLAPGVSTPAIETLMARARAAGGRAAKVCGAGGGGCLFCLADPDAVPGVRAALADGGARVLDCRIDTGGLLVTAD
jgi:D-glycero-alpha-D-manno-heptose-7-phosphate kinase